MKKVFAIVLSVILAMSATSMANDSEIKTVRDIDNSIRGIFDYFHNGIPTGFNGSLYVYEPSDSIDYCAYFLEEFGVITKQELSLYERDETVISRRDILDILYRIKEPLEYEFEKVENKEQIQEVMQFAGEPIWGPCVFGTTEYFEFQDVPYESDDYLPVYNYWSSSLLRGVKIDGKKYARIDEQATYSDAIAFVSRLFLSAPSFTEEDMIIVLEEMGYKDNYMFHFAERINLINSDNLLDVSTPEITIEQLNEPITRGEFYWLLYRALYVPVFGTSDLGMPFYYINNYVTNGDGDK